MSSEILAVNPSSVDPVLWRTVTLVQDKKKRRNGQLDAGDELTRRLEEVHRQALAEGLVVGRKEAEEQIPSILENLARTQSELERVLEQVRGESIEEMVRLAGTIAARVIHRETVIDPDALAGLVRAAFLKLQSREITRVRMHPALESVVHKSLEQCGAPKSLVLMTDTGLKPGELFFETGQGILDASLDTQLREIERNLVDKLGT
jgi:flagellar assembly protein FliH